MKRAHYSDYLYLLCKLMLCPRILPVFPQPGIQGFPAFCKALEVFLCGRLPPLANVVVFMQVGVHALLTPEKRIILLKLPFSREVLQIFLHFHLTDYSSSCVFS